MSDVNKIVANKNNNKAVQNVPVEKCKGKIKLSEQFNHTPNYNHVAAALPQSIHNEFYVQCKSDSESEKKTGKKFNGLGDDERDRIQQQIQNQNQKPDTVKMHPQEIQQGKQHNIPHGKVLQEPTKKDKVKVINEPTGKESPGPGPGPSPKLTPASTSSSLALKLSELSESTTETETEGSMDFGMPGYGNGPLLGSEELEKYLNGRKARVQVTTWNMGSLPPPKEYHLQKLFYHEQLDESLNKIDMHVISIQECWPDADAWEMELQICLGPSYALFHSISFGTLHISIFLRRDLIWFTTEPSDYTLSVRSGRLFKTKGSAGIQFGFFGTKFLFISAHLSAGHEPEREKQRIEELKKIIESYGKFTGRGMESPDVIFLCGDLNFRISGMTREDMFSSLRGNQIGKILAHDELNMYFSKHKDSLPKCFVGFQEAAMITFRPTYKYDIGTDEFDTSSKKRCPAYTDRVIYKCTSKSRVSSSSHSKTKLKDKPSKHNHQSQNHMKECHPSHHPHSHLPTTTEVVCLAYESVPGIRLSDHRPVYAIFTVQIKPGFDTLPLSGARFKKELFTKAAQKRAKFLLERRKKLASTLCTVT